MGFTIAITIVGLIFIFILILHFTKKNCNLNIKETSLRFKIFYNNLTITGEKIMVPMTNTQFVEITLAPKDRRGFPAPVENVVWESSNPEMLQIVPDPENPAHIRVNALGPNGAAQINVTADVNMDPEVVEALSDFVAFEIRASFATSLGLATTEPQEQILN